MQRYRAYLLNPAGKIMRALDLEAETPRAALDQALATGHPHEVEIWMGAVRLERAAAAAPDAADTGPGE